MRKTLMKYLPIVLTFSLVLLTGCDLFTALFGNIGENTMVSECGGFHREGESDDDEYCADEILLWEYDQVTKTVHFCNENVWLNCCGKHAMTITKEQDIYVINEEDKPEFGGGRCDCMCFFDFAIDLPDMQPESIPVALYRHVTDEGSRTQVWQGEIDLVQQQGNILIQSDVGWCFKM